MCGALAVAAEALNARPNNLTALIVYVTFRYLSIPNDIKNTYRLLALLIGTGRAILERGAGGVLHCARGAVDGAKTRLKKRYAKGVTRLSARRVTRGKRYTAERARGVRRVAGVTLGCL